DRRVHDPEDFTRTIGLKILGVVPHLERRGRIRAPEDALHVLEAMRGTCLNLLHAHGIGPVIVTVTSPGRADGKSFVASNLAVAFADAGYRTLLVDGDVRCGMLHRTLKLARKPGLTDLLQGRATKEQVLQPSAYGTLSFLGSGSRTHDGPTLVSPAALPLAPARLRSSYDAIIVDSSPLAAGPDAIALGTATGPPTPATLAVGFLALCGLTRTDAQTAVPAASTHRLTQRRADLEQRLQRLVGMAETGQYDKGVSPEIVRVETTYIQRRLKEG